MARLIPPICKSFDRVWRRRVLLSPSPLDRFLVARPRMRGRNPRRASLFVSIPP